MTDAESQQRSQQMEHDRYWLHKARLCHKGSTDFLDANYRKQWQQNIAHFNNDHDRGSRFYSVNYRSRNKLFRPKTRSVAIKSEAPYPRPCSARST